MSVVLPCEISNLGRCIEENNILEFNYFTTSLVKRSISLSHSIPDWQSSLSSVIIDSCKKRKISIAASLHFLDQLKRLGYDFNETVTQQHYNPLQLAISSRLPNEVILHLVKLGVNVNYTGNSNTFAPLAFACQEDNLEYVKILLDAGACKITQEGGAFEYPLAVMLEKKSNKFTIAKSILEKLPYLIYSFIRYDECDVIHHVLHQDLNWKAYPYEERVKYLVYLLSFQHKHLYGSKIVNLKISNVNDKYAAEIEKEQHLQEEKFYKYKRIKTILRDERAAPTEEIITTIQNYFMLQCDNLATFIIDDFIKNDTMKFLNEDYSLVLHPIYEEFCETERNVLNDYFKRNLQIFQRIQQLYIDNILPAWNLCTYNISTKLSIVHIIMNFLY